MDKYGAKVRGEGAFWDNDNNKDNDMDNDADVKGLCFQCMHAHHQRRAEAVLVLQSHNGGGERLLCQAHHVAPQAGEQGQEKIGQGRGYMGHNNNNNRNNNDNTHAHNNHINIKAHHMPKILILALCHGSHTIAHESMEYWLDNHGLDVLPCGENGLGGVTRPPPPYKACIWLEAHKTWMR